MSQAPFSSHLKNISYRPLTVEADCSRRALPAGTRLLCVGPHKAGTTAVRAVLFAAKETGDTVPTGENWARLLKPVEATGTRTSVVSGEFFADARVHVLVTLRPLVRIMPSR